MRTNVCVRLIDPGAASIIPIGVLRRRFRPTRFCLTGAAPAATRSRRHLRAAPPGQKCYKFRESRNPGCDVPGSLLPANAGTCFAVLAIRRVG
jgi:hypothetical protein